MYSSAQAVAKQCKVETRDRRYRPLVYLTEDGIMGCGFCDFFTDTPDVRVVLEHMKQEHPEELSGLAKWPDGEFVIIDETMLNGELTVPEDFLRDE